MARPSARHCNIGIACIGNEGSWDMEWLCRVVGGGMVKANEEDTARCSIRRAARALSCGCGGGGGYCGLEE